MSGAGGGAVLAAITGDDLLQTGFSGLAVGCKYALIALIRPSRTSTSWITCDGSPSWCRTLPTVVNCSPDPSTGRTV